MITRLTILFLLLTFRLPPSGWYFAAGGSDTTGDGSIGNPYRTIAKLNLLTLTSSDIVYFNGGDTFTGQITQTTNGITYTSYGTGKAILTGLVPLTSWTGPSSNIYTASINSGSFMEVVTMNNQFVLMGRSPNSGSYWNIDSHVNSTGGDGISGFTGQTLTSTSLTTNWVGGRVYIRKNAYNTDRDVITSYSGTTIGYSTYNNKGISNDGNKIFVQNHLGTVTAQNEWYYNPTAHTIQFYSTTDPSSFGIKAAQYDFAFRINNTSGTNSHDFTFRNLVFSGYDSVALCFVGANNITIKSCDFKYIGVNAVTLGVSDAFGNNFCNNLVADSNTISNCGNSGIDSHFTQGGVRIRYNTIDSCGVWEDMGLPNNQQRDGIQVDYPDGNSGSANRDSVIIMYNKVSHVGYCGIRFEGGWARAEYNTVDYFGMQASDGGGLYTSRNGYDSVTNKRTVLYNIIRHSYGNNATMSGGGTGGMPGIYFDDNSVNINASYNTIDSATRHGIFLHNNKNITLQYNNIFNSQENAGIGSEHDQTFGSDFYTTRGLDIQYNNIYSNSTKFIYLTSWTGSDIASFGTINNNKFARPSLSNAWGIDNAGSSTNYSSLSAWTTAQGYDAASSYIAVTSDSMQLIFNATLVTVTKSFPGFTYRDLNGTDYTDSMVLGPMESKIVRKVTYAAPPGPGQQTIFSIIHDRKNVINVQGP